MGVQWFFLLLKPPNIMNSHENPPLEKCRKKYPTYKYAKGNHQSLFYILYKNMRTTKGDKKPEAWQSFRTKWLLSRHCMSRQLWSRRRKRQDFSHVPPGTSATGEGRVWGSKAKTDSKGQSVSFQYVWSGCASFSFLETYMFLSFLDM